MSRTRRIVAIISVAVLATLGSVGVASAHGSGHHKYRAHYHRCHDGLVAHVLCLVDDVL
jgi:hypothetical protein